MGRNPSRELDKTFLSLDNAEERGLLHRDYIAHCLRWSHVVKYLNHGHRYKDAIVLDVGCGKEMPLAKLLYVNKMSPKKYVGIDANRFDIPEMLHGKKIPLSIWCETDFCTIDPEDVGICIGTPSNGKALGVPQFATDGRWFAGDGQVYDLPNIVTCFEVLEHVTPAICRRMVQHFAEVSSPDCHYFASTPCWNGSAAENHVNEMTFGALGSLFEDLGFTIVSVNGTFASIHDYQDELSSVSIYSRNDPSQVTHTDLTHVFAALRNYYDTNVLAVLFAPLFPAKSRNCLWHLTKCSPATRSIDGWKTTRMFPPLAEQPGPWSQHATWRKLAED